MDIFIALCTACFITIIFYYWRFKKYMEIINRIPGPTGLPLFGNSLTLLKSGEGLFKLSIDWNNEYKGYFRVWVGPKAYVFISRPEDIQVLLTSDTHLDKSDNYSMLHDWIGKGLLTRPGRDWPKRRKLISPSFTMRVLENFVGVFNSNSAILAKTLLMQEGKVVDVHAFTKLYTLDVICETAMGTTINAQEIADSNYVDAINVACCSMFNRSLKPWLTPSMTFNLSSYGRQYHQAVRTILKRTRQVFTTRKERMKAETSESSSEDCDTGIKRRHAFLDHLLMATVRGAELSESDIQEEVNTFMFAGNDTTSSALAFILYNLAAHSDVQERTLQEVHDTLGGSDRELTYNDLKSMNYTERVIKESLRLYPSVPIFGRELKADLHLPGGRIIPAGCSVMVGCMMVGRDAEHWPNPDEFDPDRFLPENADERHPFAFVPFSAGPRNCIGQKFGMLELKSAVSKIVRKCRLDLPSPDYKLSALEGQVVLKAKDGIKLKFSPRAPAAVRVS